MALEGKRVLVTGGAGALGRALVPRLIADGAWVALTYRSNENLAKLLTCIDADGPQPDALYCDLADADSVERLAEELAHDLPLDGLACLAGGWTGGQPAWEAPRGQMHDMIRTNVLPTWLTLQRFVPGMVEAGHGRVVTMGAKQVPRPMKGNAAYAAAKGAVAALTSTLAEDLRGTGVSATCVMPSLMAEGKGVPYDEVAALIAWLLDDEAGVLDGACLPAYGL